MGDCTRMPPPCPLSPTSIAWRVMPACCPPAATPYSAPPPPKHTDAKMVRVEPFRVTIAGGKGGQVGEPPTAATYLETIGWRQM